MKIDQLVLDHFDDPDDFARAMKLLHQSVTALSQSQSFTDYEEDFLMNLGKLDNWYLSKAERFNQRVKSEFQRLQDEIVALREALRTNTFSSTPEGQEALIDKIKETINPTLSDDENPTLNQLYDEWKDAHKDAMRETSYENSYKPAIELFIRFIQDLDGGDVRVAELKAEHIRYYQKYYSKIPKRIQPAKYSIPELIKLSGAPKAPKTILDNFSNVGTFLNWIVAKGYPIQASLTLVLIKGSDTKQEEKTSKQRQTFSDEELIKLFQSDQYTKTGKFKTSGMYWAGLIALFTGARMSEILQLEHHDIQQIDGIWAFNFDDIDHQTIDNRKHVKKDGSRRIVPIHKQLLDLGFIKYVKKRKNRLFPDEERNDKGKFDAFQKRHTNYRKKVGVTPSHPMELKDFHSFRHTVRTRLTELRTTGHASQRFDEGIIDAIVGHASKERSVGQTTYNHSQYIKAKKKALDRLQYSSIQFDRIIPWDKCEFIRKPYRARAINRLKEP